MAILVTAIDGQGSYTTNDSTTVTSSGIGADAFYMGQTDFIKDGGIVQGIDSLAVEENNPVGLSVVVKTGTAYVKNSSWTKHSQLPKFWRVDVTADETVNISSNSSGSNRVDKIVLTVDDTVTPNDSASNVATLSAEEGTTSAPATPDDSLSLAEVTIASGAASISQSNITNTRNFVLQSKATDGWLEVTGSPVYVNGTTIRFENINLTSLFSVGDGLKFDQPTDGTKYFYIIGITYTGGNTDITIEAGDDYDLDNEAITNFHYSKNPQTALNFPQSFSYTPTFGGFSTSPTGDFKFFMLGRLVFVDIQIGAGDAGVSNASSFTMSTPIPANAPAGFWISTVPFGENNGSNTLDVFMQITDNSDMEFGINASTAGWTSSGDKRVRGVISYMI